MAAANTDNFLKVYQNFSTTIGAGGVTSGTATTIPLTSTTNLPTDTAIAITINRVDSSGNATNNAETVIGVVSGTNLTNCVRAVEGTGQAWGSGIVVELLWVASAWNRAVSAILSEHNQDGTHAVISGPQQSTTPTSPASGKDKLYFKTDDRLYKLSSAGTEKQVVSQTFPSTFANFVQSGLTIPTSATLSTTSVAGTIYYNGVEISVPSDGGHTYTASNDCYVDVSNAGAYTYNTVANGAAAPALTANSIRIAKVVTSGTAVTGVTQDGSLDSNNVQIYPTKPALAPVSGTSYLETVNSPTINTPITNQGIIPISAQAFDGTQKGNLFTRTLAASETFTQSGFAKGRVFLVKVQQGTSTSYTVTWWSGITWITSGGTAPTQTTTSNGYTTYGFICTGTNTFDGYLVSTQ